MCPSDEIRTNLIFPSECLIPRLVTSHTQTRIWTRHVARSRICQCSSVIQGLTLHLQFYLWIRVTHHSVSGNRKPDH